MTLKLKKILCALSLCTLMVPVFSQKAEKESFSLPQYGVVFGAGFASKSYDQNTIRQAVDKIAEHFQLVRIYTDLGDLYEPFMDEAEKKGIDVILGVADFQLFYANNLFPDVKKAREYVQKHAYKNGQLRSNLKVILVGNELYLYSFNDKEGTFKKDIQYLIESLKEENLNQKIAVSVDLGPELDWDAQPNCQFKSVDPFGQSYNVGNVLKVLAANVKNNGAPGIVFGNLYPLFAPVKDIKVDSADKMLYVFAGTQAKSQYNCLKDAIANSLGEDNASLLNVSIGETGWSTEGDMSSGQSSSVELLNTYLHAYTEYVENRYQGQQATVPYKGLTSLFFEAFDEPNKGNGIGEAEKHFGLYPDFFTAPAKQLKPKLDLDSIFGSHVCPAPTDLTSQSFYQDEVVYLNWDVAKQEMVTGYNVYDYRYAYDKFNSKKLNTSLILKDSPQFKDQVGGGDSTSHFTYYIVSVCDQEESANYLPMDVQK